MAIYKFVDSVLHALDDHRDTIGIFYDLRKAFDCADHRILLDKIKSYVIAGIANQWIKSYLSDRSQVVKIKAISDKQVVSIGVPQGSILGPILFLLHIYDLPSYFNQGVITMYADDTNHLMRYTDNSVNTLQQG
jgi:hypothetical protein